ncbi:outer membrane protein OmpT [Vibrio xiamenensis]|uniref:Outer membrane protein OmpT n=1 Tax=Vibrio xiamenensis TaxID=861298 RepID=A0A1G7WPK5_9VIBR|nr:porin [Vibrio xiamenensis]SDG73852.1 outer membrane protein OmpT [Vibrio xiamenensis]
MKKTLLAIVVAATAATSVNAAEILKTDTASVDFWGQIREELRQKKEDADVTLKSGSSRAGVDARYAASDAYDVFGSIEFNIGDTDSDNFMRKHYVGIDAHEYGKVSVGLNSILSDDVWGAENSKFGGASVLPESGGNYVGWLQQGMIKYEVESDSAWFKLAYSADNSSADYAGGDIGADLSTTEAFAGTSFGAISVYGGGGIYNIDGGDDIKHGMITVAYDADNWNIGTTYWHSKNDALDLSSDSIVVAGSAKVADKTSVYGGYEFIKDFSTEGNDYNNVYAGVEYKLASWARTYAEYATHTQTESTDDSYWGVGVRVYW